MPAIADLSEYLPLTGGTVTGELALSSTGSILINGVADVTTNYQRLKMYNNSSNVLNYDLQKGGTGTVGYHNFCIDGTNKLNVQISTSQFYVNLLAGLDNTYTLGRKSATPYRFSEAYFGTSCQIGAGVNILPAGALHVVSTGISVITSVIECISSQTANAVEVRKADASVVLSVSPSGSMVVADTISQRNSTTAQKTEVYNTYTSSTSYERAVIDWVTTANTCKIGTEKGASGGTARDLCFITDSTARLTINGTTGLATFAAGVSISGGVAITLGSDATGDILYRNSGGAIARLPIGSTNQVLTVAGGLPSWAAASGGGASWSYATGTDAATAMAVNTWYNVDMSAWATADRIYSLPSTAAVGDRVAVYITAGNTTTFELDLRTTSGSSDTIRGVDRSSSSWSRLFITGELVIFECTVANTDWAVSYDGRIPCEVIMARTTAKTGNTNAADAEIDGYGTPSVNVGNLANATNGRVTARRACRALLGGKTRFTYTSGAIVGDGSVTILMAKVNGANDAQRQDQYSVIGAAAFPIVVLAGEVDLVVGDYCSLFGFVNDSRAGTFEMGSASWNYPRLVFRELLAP